jgi:hypothetical protein
MTFESSDRVQEEAQKQDGTSIKKLLAGKLSHFCAIWQVLVH